MASQRAPRRKTGGRQKGTPNKKKAEFREALQAYCASIGVDPHRFMADMIADKSETVIGMAADGSPIMGPTVKLELKFYAARELAQYIEPKLKAIDHTGNLEQTVKIIEVSLG